MKNKNYMKYVNLSILSILLLQVISPIAVALEQTCTASQNFTVQLSVSGQNQTFNVSSEGNAYVYNAVNGTFNITDSKVVSLLRNISCTYNLTDTSNVSLLQNVLYNISKSAEVIAKDSAERTAYFPLYTGCISNFSFCQAQLNISQSKGDFQTLYNACLTEKTNVEASRNSLNTQLTDPVNGCQKQLENVTKERDSKNNWLIWGLIGGGLGGFMLCYYLKVKPKTGTDTLHKESSGFE